MTYRAILRLTPFSDIGGGGKRKPPPMHRKRRLREPVKIHRRRRNCSTRAVTLLCVFTRIVSQAFLRRVPSPLGLGYCSSPPCAGNLFCHGGTGIHPCPATASYCTTKSGLRRKTPHVRIRRRRPIRALSAGRSL